MFSGLHRDSNPWPLRERCSADAVLTRKHFSGLLCDCLNRNTTAMITYSFHSYVRSSHNIHMYILLTKREVKMAGYWPSSLFAFLWTETKSRSVHKNVKREQG